MVEKVKLHLRIKSGAYDEEIQGLIDACVAEMKRVTGIFVPDLKGGSYGDPLLDRAIILYCKSHFGYDGESDKFKKAYDHIIFALKHAGVQTDEMEG